MENKITERKKKKPITKMLDPKPIKPRHICKSD
jgi:hypothetical protein